ncbi:uncharacterized protein L203_101773 [Cryptococcus depauperatus CBS 7841]|uniref:Leucine carboxyl methyltransferase 1 n=1 Tax=Cryptococcus depauperatus CBS 7841 TaxID=1295531 RepID=A0AAJ8LYN0_9TREE
MSSSASSHPDDAIRLTDDDAASSRLSATQRGYILDPFASLLYKPPMSDHTGSSCQSTKKPPLINVGTHHRTWGIDILIDQFLDNGGKQVVSLGAGSDTRFWRLISRPITPNISKYIEIDFPHLTSPKAQRIARHHKLSQYLSPTFTSEHSSGSMAPPSSFKSPYTISKGGTRLASPLYDLIPLDLRSSTDQPSQTISDILSSELLPLLDPSLPTLFLAECLFPYMLPQDSQEIVKWFGKTFGQCMGVVYEMVGLDDAFGKVMRRNLSMRNLEIPGSDPFPTPESHAERLTTPQLGEGKFDKAGAKTLWQIRQEIIEPAELQRISKLEILDEIEELRLVLEHYVITWGTKGTEMMSITL